MLAEMVARVEAPLLSVNEPEAQVAEVCVAAGRKVSPGDLLCVLSTTKASFDVQSEVEGFVHRIFITAGQTVAAGAVMFEIGSSPLLDPAPLDAAPPPAVERAEPDGLRITDPARRLVAELGISLAGLPRDRLVTEALVCQLAARGRDAAAPPARLDASSVVILGAGGHARKLIDLLRQQSSLRLAGVVADPEPEFRELLGVPVLGSASKLGELHAGGLRLAINGIGGIQRVGIRVEKFDEMARIGLGFPAIIHPRAIVEPSAAVSAGAQIFEAAVVGPAAVVGFGAIVNTGAIVSHDCVIGDYAHLTPGVILAGEVKVGAGALVGMGVTTAVGVTIGEWARIGNGARIHADVPPRAIIQAGAAWPGG